MKKIVSISSAVMFMLLLTACSSHQEIVSGPIVKEETTVIPDPGAVEFVYEPPILDVIDIPPGLDPEGIYYVPGHSSVVELRQGRWRYYKNPSSVR